MADNGSEVGSPTLSEKLGGLGEDLLGLTNEAITIWWIVVSSCKLHSIVLGICVGVMAFAIDLLITSKKLESMGIDAFGPKEDLMRAVKEAVPAMVIWKTAGLVVLKFFFDFGL